MYEENVEYCFGEDPGNLPLEEIEIKKAEINDIPGVVSVENAAWPSTDGSMTATEEKFLTRQSIGGLLVAKRYGEHIGIISYQRPSWTNSDTVENILNKSPSWTEIINQGFPKDWYTATNSGLIQNNGYSTHDPESDVGFLIGVAIHPSGRGKKLVDKLIQAALGEMKKDGLKYALGYGRLPYYHKHKEIPVEEYVKLKKEGSDPPFDYGLRFHIRNGAKMVCPIPNAMWDDEESLGFGTLVVYKLR